MTDLASLDATAQAELVRRGEVKPADLVEAAIECIERLDPHLNALTTARFDRALDEARSPELPDGPFRGVPFVLKDLAAPMAGEPSHEGMRALKEAGHTATFDSHLVRRYRRAGLVVVGRTNTPELGLTATTEPASYGPTRNPWDPTRTAGGSSGGSAAAVAAGLVPAAHASDGGGSIRIPAACCGLVGLKPSRGRVSLGPAAGELARPLSVQFALTRTVRDCAALLDVAAGPEPGDPVQAPAPARPFAAEVGADPGRLRIGAWYTYPGGEQPVHADCVDAVRAAADLLGSLGHHVEEAHPAPLDAPERVSFFATLWAAGAASALRQWSTVLGRELGEEDVEPLTWLFAERGRHVSAVEYLDAIAAMQEWCRRVTQWWDGFDLLLTPALGEPPPPLGELHTPDDPMRGFARTGLFTPYTPWVNQTGQPAVALPFRVGAEGLPLGVHLVAAYGREDLLIRVASQFEAAVAGTLPRPSIHAGNGT